MNEQDLQAIKDGLEAGVITPEQAQQCIEIIEKRQADKKIEELLEEPMNHYQKAQEVQRAKNEAVFLLSCNLINLITEIRDLAQVRLYGTSDKWIEAVEKLPRLVFKTLPRLVLELQNALQKE